VGGQALALDFSHVTWGIEFFRFALRTLSLCGCVSIERGFVSCVFTFI
jgi:hypothetical protein